MHLPGEYLSKFCEQVFRRQQPSSRASPFFSLLHFLFPFYVPTRGREKNREMHLAVSRINISGHPELSPKKEKKENNGGEGEASPLHIGKFPPLPSVYCGCFSCKKKSSSSYFSGGMEVRAFAVGRKNVELKDDRSPLSVFG